MARLRKKVFVDTVCCIVAVLAVVRWCCGDALMPAPVQGEAPEVTAAGGTVAVHDGAAAGGGAGARRRYHPIRGVHSYAECFPDVQDVHYASAQRHGVAPVRNRAEAEQRKQELLYVGLNPYYRIDPAMNRSIPYLVPRASWLLQHIGRAFADSLAAKGVPPHAIIVTSVMRTEEDVARLRRVNGNASEQSCHRFGTTFDIAYNRYHTVQPPAAEARRAVRSDTLKYILSEVLRDARAEGLCHVKHEVRQGCFHITVR